MPLSDRIRPCVLYGDESATSAFSAESAAGRPGRPAQAEGLPHHRTTQSRKWTAARRAALIDRKSTRLNSSHLGISYAVFCLKTKKHKSPRGRPTHPPDRLPHTPTRHDPP